jgi:hypothetical protein
METPTVFHESFSMPYSANISVTSVIDGTTQQQTTTITGTTATKFNFTLPAASTGTLTTRTDDNTGVVTAASGHGIVTSDTVCVFWTDTNGDLQYRSGMTATVATNAITVGGGDGTTGISVLPAASTAVTISKLDSQTLDSDPTISALEILSISAGSNSLLAQLRSVPAAQAKVNFLCEGTGNINFSGVPSLFAAANTDTTIGTVQFYPASTNAITVQITFLL